MSLKYKDAEGNWKPIPIPSDNTKLDKPAAAGTAGQVLGLNEELKPEWVDQTGGGSEYTAGDGIDISEDNEISVTNEVFKVIPYTFEKSDYEDADKVSEEFITKGVSHKFLFTQNSTKINDISIPKYSLIKVNTYSTFTVYSGGKVYVTNNWKLVGLIDSIELDEKILHQVVKEEDGMEITVQDFVEKYNNGWFVTTNTLYILENEEGNNYIQIKPHGKFYLEKDFCISGFVYDDIVETFVYKYIDLTDGWREDEFVRKSYVDERIPDIQYDREHSQNVDIYTKDEVDALVKTNIETLKDNSSITLADNTEYYGTDILALNLEYPAENFECYLSFSIASEGTIDIQLDTSKYIGEIPQFENGGEYEISIKNAVVIIAKVGVA